MKRWMAFMMGVYAVCALVGCATVWTEVSESSVDAATGDTYTFGYTAKTTGAPFGKVDATAHKLGYVVGADEASQLNVGQDASGIDNTAQTQVVSVLATALAQAATSGVLGGVGAGAGVSAGSGSGTILTRINAALEEIEGIRAALEGLGVELPKKE